MSCMLVYKHFERETLKCCLVVLDCSPRHKLKGRKITTISQVDEFSPFSYQLKWHEFKQVLANSRKS